MILSPDSEFFDYLKSDQPRGRTAQEDQRAAEDLRDSANGSARAEASQPEEDAEPAAATVSDTPDDEAEEEDASETPTN